jgi:hypothetical protein
VPSRPTDDVSEKQAREDLAKLLELIKSSPELENYFKTRNGNLAACITDYDTMWTYFKPGTKIVAKIFLGELQVLQVSLAPVPRYYFRQAQEDPKLLAWCWDWNGKGAMVKVYYRLTIDRFWGTKPLDELYCYPLEYHRKDEPEERAKFLQGIKERGMRYKEIVKSPAGAKQMYEYKGVALSESRSIIESDLKDKAGYAFLNFES